MADRFWVGATDGTWNDAGNWSASTGGGGGAGIPGASDAAIFDGAYTGTANCTCDVAIDIASLDVQVGHDGKFDLGDNAYAHAVAGNVTAAGVGEFDCGDATLTCSGDFANSGQTTWTRGTSIVVLDGASKTIASNTSNDLYELTIDGTITATGPVDVQGPFTVNAGKQLTCDATVRKFGGGAVTVAGTVSINLGKNFRPINLAVPAGGQITGDGRLTVSNGSVTDATGTIDPEILEFLLNVTVAPGTYGSATGTVTATNSSGARTLTLGGTAGTFVFPGDVAFDVGGAGTYDIDADTNNASIEFQGDVTFEETNGTLTFTKPTGNGTVTFGGTTDYDDDTAAGINIGDVEVSGALSLSSALECDDFDVTATGSVDLNETDIDCNGDMDCVAGATLQGFGTNIVTVDGNFTADGQDLTPATSAWQLNVAGTAVASGVGNVDECNANGGTEITALLWTDSGNNFNWDFGVVPAGHPLMRRWGGVPHMIPGPQLTGRSW